MACVTDGLQVLRQEDEKSAPTCPTESLSIRERRLCCLRFEVLPCARAREPAWQIVKNEFPFFLLLCALPASPCQSRRIRCEPGPPQGATDVLAAVTSAASGAHCDVTEAYATVTALRFSRTFLINTFIMEHHHSPGCDLEGKTMSSKVPLEKTASL